MTVKRFILFFATLFCLQSSVIGQIYPTAVNPTILGPCSIYFEDFYSAMNPKLNILLQLNDLSVAQRDVYLKMKITGPGLSISSLPNSRPPVPITLTAGIPSTLFGADISSVFDFNNLVFSGISRQQLEVNGRLPEGAYMVCFTIMDYQQNIPLSQETCVPVQLALSDPPTILNPMCGNVIEQINPTNFLFNWMLTNSNSLVDLSNLSYQINLYEVTPQTANPQTAILNNQALKVWESELINGYVYNYGITNPALEVGKKYAYTIQAIENYPKSQIKNNGYSAPCWFYFGYPEGGKIELTKPDSSYQFNLNDIGLFGWKRPNNALPGQLVSYDYKLVKVNSGQSPVDAILNNPVVNTYTINPTTEQHIHYTIPHEVLNGLEKMNTYAWTVEGRSGTQTIAKSGISTFIAPPHIDRFYAANFLVNVTKVTAYDSITNIISGSGKTVLNGLNESPEFDFENVQLQSAGNNLWIMVGGLIQDDIILSGYDMSPKTFPINGTMSFQPDSIFIDPEELRLGGKCSVQLPLITDGDVLPQIVSRYSRLTLTNLTFELSYEDPIELEDNYNFPLLEPFGFRFLVDQPSKIQIYKSKYELYLDGFLELPSKVKEINNSPVLIPYRNQQQVNYMSEDNSPFLAEQIDFLEKADFGLRAKSYIIDLTESKSPGDLAADSLWKGLYFLAGELVIPTHGEETEQLIADEELKVLFANEPSDSNSVFVDDNGLHFVAAAPFSTSEVLKFNTFPSSSTILNIDIRENFFNSGEIVGNIQIPVIDTARLFPYTVPLTSNGFTIGNIDESLVDLAFVFNAGGGDEERVNMTITRAVFRDKNRIEMDLDAVWPHFQTTLSNLQGFNAWGNGNIGFDIPNGAASLNDQSIAKSGDYNMVIDYVGCGRNLNAYAFGVSAKMNMAENISGENSAPIVNGYSVYINPLLDGVFTGNSDDPNSILSGFNPQDTSVSTATIANAANLSGDLDSYGENLGINYTDSLSHSEGSNGMISEGTYIQLKRIVEIAEIFVQFMDSTKAGKALDYIAVAQQALNSDIVKGAVNKDPKEFLNDILEDALDGLIKRVNKPIENATLYATGKFRNLVNDNVTDPINNKIDTVLSKIFDKITQQVASRIEDPQALEAVKTIINSIKSSIGTEITESVSASIENNITKKITDFIEEGISKQVTNFVATQIKYVGMELINNGVHADIKLQNIVNDAGDLFKDIGDTIVSGVKSISMRNIVKTAESLVEDAFTGINWDDVLARILNDAANQGLNALVDGVLANALDGLGGEAFASLMSNVQFDFSNLGEKIKSGDLKGIVKFDPTNISIKTSACEIKGQLKHTKDDPIYGDHWRAMVEIKLLKPEKLKDVFISALFVTGKTGYSAPVSANYVSPVDPNDAAAVAAQQAELAADLADSTIYSYWFASLDVGGLTVPLSPIPLYLNGIGGFAYHHMQKDSPTAFPVPCRRNKLGLGVKFQFTDMPMTGKIVKLEMQLEVIINHGAWAMEMYAEAKVGNKGGASGNFPPIATATGIMGYYSALKTFKGEIVVVFNTSPLLCAGGTIKFHFDGLNHTWYVSAGTQQEPIFAKLLCKDWLSVSAFVEAQNTGFKAGLDVNIDIKSKSPWLDFGAVEVRGVAEFYFKFNSYVELQFEPDFKLMEAYIYLAAGASISVEWQTAVKSDSFTIAGVAIAGHVHYKAAPEGNLNGGLSGSVTVLGISCGIDFNVNYDFGNRSDNS